RKNSIYIGRIRLRERPPKRRGLLRPPRVLPTARAPIDEAPPQSDAGPELQELLEPPCRQHVVAAQVGSPGQVPKGFESESAVGRLFGKTARDRKAFVELIALARDPHQTLLCLDSKARGIRHLPQAHERLSDREELGSFWSDAGWGLASDLLQSDIRAQKFCLEGRPASVLGHLRQCGLRGLRVAEPPLSPRQSQQIGRSLRRRPKRRVVALEQPYPSVDILEVEA